MTPTRVLGWVRDEVGTHALGIVLGAYDLFEAAWTKGWSGVVDLLAGKVEGLLGPDLTKALGNAAKGEGIEPSVIFKLALDLAVDAASKVVLAALIKQVLQALLSLADVSGITPILMAIYRIYLGVDWVLGKIDKLADLLTKAADAVDALLMGNIQGLADQVENGLIAVAGLLLSLLAKQLKLGNVPNVVATAIMKLQKKVERLAKQLIKWLVSVGKRLLGLGNGDGIQAQLTRMVQSKDGKVTVWLEDRGGKAEVIAQASPAAPAMTTLVRLEKTAPATEKDQVKQAESAVQAAQTLGQPLLLKATGKTQLMMGTSGTPDKPRVERLGKGRGEAPGDRGRSGGAGPGAVVRRGHVLPQPDLGRPGTRPRAPGGVSGGPARAERGCGGRVGAPGATAATTSGA